jgi:hypothetical protein
MKLAIIGLPQAGKSTVFNALTRRDAALEVSGIRVEVHSAMVDVPDARLLDLANLYSSKKIVHAQIALADVAGFGAGSSGEALSGQLLNALSGMDGLIIVLRAFEDDAVPHAKGSIDADRDLANLLEDLMLNDLIAVERKLERLAEERQKSGRDVAVVERELLLFQRVQEGLNSGTPLRNQELSPEERTQLAGLGFLTQNAILAIRNIDEGDESGANEIQGVPVLGLQGKLEMELAQLSDEEAAEFSAEYGLQESARNRIIRAAFEMLNTQTFYTVADTEAHAWMLKKDSNALKAAETIHSDIARGFIRAEIIGAAELLELGSRAKARDVGKLRLEGKEYTMQDGDIINVRFNV